MRAWGRTYDGSGNPTGWVEVTTDSNGFNDAVYFTTLAQTLLLGLGESPFYGDRGIPAQQAVATYIPPDYYVRYTQRLFAQYFASIVIDKQPQTNPSSPPTYNINVVTNQGTQLNASVPVPI